MSVQSDLFDNALTRRIYLERYSDGEARRVAAFLREVQADIKAELVRAYEGGFNEFRLKTLLKNVEDLYKDVYARMNDRIWTGFEGLAGQQAEATGAALQTAAAAVEARFSQLSASRALAAVKARPLQGKFLRDMVSDLPKLHRQRMVAQIRIAYVEGESLTRAARRVSNVTGQNTRFLKGFIRTANAHISSVAAKASYENNPGLVEKYEWLSTLDSRTTLICQGLDGNRYPVGKGPVPPAHFGCRSTTYPILKGMKPLPRETFNDWIKRQPKAAQDEILGPGRAALVRDGMNVDRFVDLTGKTLTLKQLAALS